MVLMLLAVVTVLLGVVALGESGSSDWATTAQYVAYPIAIIAFVGIVLAIAVGRR